MKRLVIFRHAKTEPSNPHGDFVRELTSRGRKDAARMAVILEDVAGFPDVVVTSTAKRALQTTKILHERLAGRPEIREIGRLYLADPGTLLEIVRSLDDSFQRAVLVGHNPGLIELANEIAEPSKMLNSLPTSGFVVADSKAEHWDQFSRAEADVIGMWTPKHTDGV